jgi:hypothetical protein
MFFANVLEKSAKFWILKILKKKALIHKFNCTPPHPKKEQQKKEKKKKKGELKKKFKKKKLL